jgi:hypothetical protein
VPQAIVCTSIRPIGSLSTLLCSPLNSIHEFDSFFQVDFDNQIELSEVWFEYLHQHLSAVNYYGIMMLDTEASTAINQLVILVLFTACNYVVHGSLHVVLPVQRCIICICTKII